jgi:hypothetical protein
LNIAPGTPGLKRAETSPLSQGVGVKLSVGSENPESRDVCVDLLGQRNGPREGA